MGKKCGWFHGGRIAGMALLLLCSLVFAGCGKEADPEPSEERMEEVQESAGSPDETEDVPGNAGSPDGTEDVLESPAPLESGMAEEPSGSFTFNSDKLFEAQAAVGEQGKIVLRLQDSVASSWLRAAVDGFNRKSDTYFIKLLESGYEANLTSCRDRMSVEIVAGKGPDLFTGDVFPVNEGIIEKGYLEDLAPKLEEFEITDEKYFPSVRALSVGDGVYAVCPYAWPEGYWILESVLGSREQPDIETLVEKLHEYPDQDVVLWRYASAMRILEYLLFGSEDLWGTLDWEERTCDFSGELFAKIMEIAKRYQDPEGNNENAVSGWFFPCLEDRESLENEGKVFIDFLFDNGCYPYYRTSHTLMVNASSEYKEGAWEFLKYLFSEEGQNYVAGNTIGAAANKEMFESHAEWELKMLEEGRMESNLTEKMVEDIRDYAERARYTSPRTITILDIIYEEAESYFTGDKPLETVVGIIQNRVQLYLDEMM